MPLISDEYKRLNEQLHEEREDYGMSGMKHANTVMSLSNHFNTKDILDYGCGKSSLAVNLPFDIKQYDPAIPKYSALPEEADIVVCTDVLEHIEPDNLDDVLSHLKKLIKKIGFFVIANREAKKKLPDGRNAHLIIKDGSWWFSKLNNYFDIVKYNKLPIGECIIFVERKGEF